jgi:hypothetical protein
MRKLIVDEWVTLDAVVQAPAYRWRRCHRLVVGRLLV